MERKQVVVGRESGTAQEKLYLSAKCIRESHQRVAVHVTGEACSSRVVTRTES